MIELCRGDILQAEADSLVVPVNTKGALGAGLALQVKQAFPECAADYAGACKGPLRMPGQVMALHLEGRPFRWLLFFTTKDDWRRPSKLEWIREGLPRLVSLVRQRRLDTVALPLLGCGLGGLSELLVRPYIEGAFRALPDVTAKLYTQQSLR